MAFKKAISDQYNLYAVFYFGKNVDNFTLTVWREEVQVNPPVPEQPFHVYVIGDFNNWGKNTPDEFEASYVDEQWTFTLEDFHVNADETFAFVTNVQDPGLQYFGLDQMVDSNFDGFLMPNFDKGPFAMKALCDFTVTFVIYGDQTLHVDFATATVGISYLTIVGSFNSWSETDGVIEMTKNGDRFEARVSLDAQMEFKVMQNHSWAINYGYNEIMAGQDANLKEYFTYNSEYGNMVTLKAVTFNITAVNDGTGHAAFKINILG